MSTPTSNSQLPIAKSPRVAIVCDWLTNMGGAEKVVLAMHEAFPDAPIYTSVFEPSNMPAFNGLDVRTTWIQKFPRALRRLHKWFPVIRVWAFRSLDLSDYDIILASTIAESKHVRKTRDDQILISYCHTPVRYYWSHYKEYKKDPGFGKFNWLIRLLIPLLVPRQKKLDFAAAQKVDLFIANSSEVQKRIKRYYKKDSIVIHPPVDIDRFKPSAKRQDYYVALGRQEPYKRIDLAIKAATELNLPLKVFGDGSQHARLVKMAGPNVSFYTDRFGNASDEAVNGALNNARGYIFPAEEDFGIVQVEALAAGAPVVAYGKGGALDIVQDGVSGILFKEQTVESLKAALSELESTRGAFKPAALRRVAQRFAKVLFVSKIQKVVADASRD